MGRERLPDRDCITPHWRALPHVGDGSREYQRFAVARCEHVMKEVVARSRGQDVAALDDSAVATAAQAWLASKVEAPADEMASQAGTVYVLESGPFVKIGFTAGPVSKRLAALQTGSPIAITVLAEIQGSAQLERALHARFANLRGSGEWFRNEGDLAEWVAAGCPMET